MRALLACLFLVSGVALAQGSGFNRPPTSPILAPGCTNGATVMWVNGGLGCTNNGSNQPTASSCGATPVVVGTDFVGTITVGTGVLTSCTLNFSKTMSAVPTCMVTNSLGANWITNVSTSSLTVASTTLTGGTIWYRCSGAI